MTQMLNATHQTPAFGPVPRSRIRPLVGRSLIVTLAAGALICGAYAPAFAEPGISTGGEAVTGTVNVGSIISLTGLDTAFELTGNPDETATDTVTYTVTTNNVGGYIVMVVPTSPVFVGSGPDTIPMEDLIASDPTITPTPVAPTGATIVHTQPFRSIPTGDALATDFSMVIPFVNSDTYTATMDYVAMTL